MYKDVTYYGIFSEPAADSNLPGLFGALQSVKVDVWAMSWENLF